MPDGTGTVELMMEKINCKQAIRILHFTLDSIILTYLDFYSSYN